MTPLVNLYTPAKLLRQYSLPLGLAHAWVVCPWPVLVLLVLSNLHLRLRCGFSCGFFTDTGRLAGSASASLFSILCLCASVAGWLSCLLLGVAGVACRFAVLPELCSGTTSAFAVGWSCSILLNP
eukprot:3955772-Amphidinium_carterae.4